MQVSTSLAPRAWVHDIGSTSFWSMSFGPRARVRELGSPSSNPRAPRELVLPYFDLRHQILTRAPNLWCKSLRPRLGSTILSYRFRVRTIRLAETVCGTLTAKLFREQTHITQTKHETQQNLKIGMDGRQCSKATYMTESARAPCGR